jgi:hypothetical protein
MGVGGSSPTLGVDIAIRTIERTHETSVHWVVVWSSPGSSRRAISFAQNSATLRFTLTSISLTCAATASVAVVFDT